MRQGLGLECPALSPRPRCPQQPPGQGSLATLRPRPLQLGRCGGPEGAGLAGAQPREVTPPPAAQGWKRPSAGLVQGGVTARGVGRQHSQWIRSGFQGQPHLGSNLRPTKPLTAGCLSFPICKLELKNAAYLIAV